MGLLWVLVCVPSVFLIFLALDSEICRDNPALRDFFVSDLQPLYKNECKLGAGSLAIIVGGTGMFFTGLMSCQAKSDEEEEQTRRK